MIRAIVLTAALTAIAAGSAAAQPFKTPIPAAQLADKPDRRAGLHAINPLSAADTEVLRQALASGDAKFQTLPVWTRAYSINGQTYHYTLVGAPPERRRRTTLPVVLVPVNLTIPDYSPDGINPLVLDAGPIISHIVQSPLFTPLPSSGNRQFEDGMLRAEFPHTSHDWGLSLSPTVAPEMNLVAPAGAVTVTQAASGKYLAIVNQPAFMDSAFKAAIQQMKAPGTLVIFVTYNALESTAFGYHTYSFAQHHTQALVWIYTSWLEQVDDALFIPSPDAVTLSHEISEAVHDPLITSTTLEWGDAFRHNKCFQNIIEVGDAIEDAPIHIQFYAEPGTIDGNFYNFQVQNEATLAWFIRDPGAPADTRYSFPKRSALTSPAPLTCTPRS